MRIFILLLVLAASVLSGGCQKTEKVTDNQGVNKWVHETLKDRYLWSGTLGGYTPSDLSPEGYLNKVRYRNNHSVDIKADFYGDRFSRIEYTGEASRSGDGASFAEGDYANDFGFTTMRYIDNNENTVYGQVIYVVPGSPAYEAGIRRGFNYDAVQVGSAIYKMPLSKDKFASAMSGNTVKFHFFYPDERVVEVTRSSYPDHPILFDSVYNTSAGKTAYLVYNHFTSGSGFDREMKDVFAEFKNKGAKNLILDLRYNGGGELGAAVLLGGLIARAGDLYKPFLYLERNVHKGQDYRRYDIIGFQSFGDVTETDNLNVDKLYIITLEHTASASELILHCLKPYFGDDLKHIGLTTYGKNVGTITITNQRYDWSLTPITMRVHDKNGVSGYEEGIKVGPGFPNTYMTDEVDYEYGNVKDAPHGYEVVGDFGEIGDRPDVMLKKVITLIDTGNWPVSVRSGNGAAGGMSAPKEAFPGIRERGLTEGTSIVP